MKQKLELLICCIVAVYLFPTSVNGQVGNFTSVYLDNSPIDDYTSSLTQLRLGNRRTGGGDYAWTIYTAATGGGFGVRPNAFEIWEYPNNPNTAVECCRPRFTIFPSDRYQIEAPKPLYIGPAGQVLVGSPSYDPAIAYGLLQIAGSKSLNWDAGQNESGLTGNVVIGDLATGGTLAVRTPSLNAIYPSGLGIDGAYSANRSVINLKAFGVKSPGGYGADIALHTSSNQTLYERMRITKDGNVNIGTSNPGDYNLTVNGNVTSKKMKVTQTGWPDYVFDRNYQLKSLDSVEAYIRLHKHLPEVPSAKQLEKDGLDVGDQHAVLLKKVEELTLYLIEMKKEYSAQLKKQEQTLHQQAEEIKQLKTQAKY